MSGFAGKWGICIFLLLATTMNYLDRQTLGILAPAIQKEMKLSNEHLGWLFSAFYYAYTFAQFGVGRLLDQGNLRWIYTLAVAGWSVACALTGMAHGFAALLLFRVLLGVMEAANWPGAMRIVALTLEPEERALGNGLFTSGTSIGALIAPSLVLGIALLYGWHWSFFLLGSLGVLWLLFWIPASSGARFTRFAKPYRDNGGAAGVYARVLRLPRFWSVFAVSILVNPALYFLLNWLPTYLNQQRGVAPGREMAAVLTIVYLALDLGNLSCGAAMLIFAKHGVSHQTGRRIVFTAASALTLCAAVLPWAPRLNTLIGMLAATAFALGAWVSMYLTMAQEVDEFSVSTVAGLLGGSGALAGAVAMWGVGRVTTLTGSFRLPFIAVSVAGLLAAAAGWRVTATRATGPSLQPGPLQPD